MISLSILIPTMPSREHLFNKLIARLQNQIEPYNQHGCTVEIVSNNRMDISIGEKRNLLMSLASGEYVCSIDDDDEVSDDYIRLLLKGIARKPDCCSLKGIITFDGKNPKVFHHTIQHEKYDEMDGVYRRYPNHLNVIKTSIAKQFHFPPKNFSEDTDWATYLHDMKALKLEYKIEEIIYYYRYNSKK